MSSTTETPRSPWLATSSRSDQFFLLAQERYRIKLRREAGEPRPWTGDPVLGAYRFCNVHREDDKTTVWFRENVRRGLELRPGEALIATTAFRWFNRIETGVLILPMLQAGVWDSEYVRRHLGALVPPLVTGAYMIKTPTGLGKLEGIIRCMEDFYGMGMVQRLTGGPRDRRETLEGFHEVLKEAPFLGDFMAYEIVTDLRHTCLLSGAPDICTWANPGPGCARGLGWIYYDDPDAFDRGSPIDRELMISEMRSLLSRSHDPRMWPVEWPRWEMREVEHWLCEFDKWCRATVNGQPLKRRYP